MSAVPVHAGIMNSITLYLHDQEGTFLR